jgi:hypothetical protein
MTIYTQAFLDELDRMIASGVKRTRFEGHEVEYRDMAELLQARSLVASHIAAASGTAAAAFVNPVFSRGC